MKDHVVELAERGKALAPEDRSRLVDLLLQSLHKAKLGETEAAWDDEIERRIAEVDAGTAELIPAEEVFDGLRRLLKNKQ